MTFPVLVSFFNARYSLISWVWTTAGLLFLFSQTKGIRSIVGASLPLVLYWGLRSITHFFRVESGDFSWGDRSNSFGVSASSDIGFHNRTEKFSRVQNQIRLDSTDRWNSFSNFWKSCKLLGEYQTPARSYCQEHHPMRCLQCDL